MDLASASARLNYRLLRSLCAVLQVSDLSLGLAATLSDALYSRNNLFVFFGGTLLILRFDLQLETAFIASVTRPI